MPPQGKHADSTSARRDLMKHAERGRQGRAGKKEAAAAVCSALLCSVLLCCRTSSQISPVHNTKQNKCPLLIKPHNKCRPFVFPFILSTARGEGSNGQRTTGEHLPLPGAQKKSCLVVVLRFPCPTRHSQWLFWYLLPVPATRLQRTYIY